MTRNDLDHAFKFMIRLTGAALLSAIAFASALPSEFGVALATSAPIA